MITYKYSEETPRAWSTIYKLDDGKLTYMWWYDRDEGEWIETDKIQNNSPRSLRYSEHINEEDIENIMFMVTL